jgi:thioredoxin-like negative regulator of GroEL
VSVAAVGAHSYADAHRTTTKTGKPMVVMVSAKWCGACKEMEKNVLPQIEKRGLLKRVSFAVVDVDREQTLARKLTRGGPLPQLVMFRRNGNGWLRRRLVGGQSRVTVEKFIKQGIEKDEAAKKALEKEKQRQPSDHKQTDSRAAEKLQVQPVSNR